MKDFSRTQQALANAGMLAKAPSRELATDQHSPVLQSCEEKLLFLKQSLQNMEMSWLSLAEQKQLLQTMQMWGIAMRAKANPH